MLPCRTLSLNACALYGVPLQSSCAPCNPPSAVTDAVLDVWKAQTRTQAKRVGAVGTLTRLLGTTGVLQRLPAMQRKSQSSWHQYSATQAFPPTTCNPFMLALWHKTSFARGLGMSCGNHCTVALPVPTNSAPPSALVLFLFFAKLQ